jgi:hypothetical protein
VAYWEIYYSEVDRLVRKSYQKAEYPARIRRIGRDTDLMEIDVAVMSHIALEKN